MKRPDAKSYRNSEMSSKANDAGDKANSPRGPVDPDYMTDETFVSGIAWSELKTKAMEEMLPHSSQFNIRTCQPERFVHVRSRS